jgi:hypothetical protein
MAFRLRSDIVRTSTFLITCRSAALRSTTRSRARAAGLDNHDMLCEEGSGAS